MQQCGWGRTHVNNSILCCMQAVDVKRDCPEACALDDTGMQEATVLTVDPNNHITMTPEQLKSLTQSDLIALWKVSSIAAIDLMPALVAVHVCSQLQIADYHILRWPEFAGT